MLNVEFYCYIDKIRFDRLFVSMVEMQYLSNIPIYW